MTTTFDVLELIELFENLHEDPGNYLAAINRMFDVGIPERIPYDDGMRLSMKMVKYKDTLPDDSKEIWWERIEKVRKSAEAGR